MAAPQGLSADIYDQFYANQALLWCHASDANLTKASATPTAAANGVGQLTNALTVNPPQRLRVSQSPQCDIFP